MESACLITVCCCIQTNWSLNHDDRIGWVRVMFPALDYCENQIADNFKFIGEFTSWMAHVHVSWQQFVIVYFWRRIQRIHIQVPREGSWLCLRLMIVSLLIWKASSVRTGQEMFGSSELRCECVLSCLVGSGPLKFYYV